VNVPEARPDATLRVVAGHPTAEELAALLIALTTVATETVASETAAPQRPAPPGGWADRSYGLRTSLRPGPRAWPLSARRGAG
jgi:hypothetical protein